jgi:hypothetical protein
MDYDTAAEIAYDSDRYYDTVGGMNKGGRPGYALGDIATMAAQAEGLPLRNNQVGITELDLRDSGGFIPPVGIKKKLMTFLQCYQTMNLYLQQTL